MSGVSPESRGPSPEERLARAAERGMTVAEAAADLNIPAWRLSHWRRLGLCDGHVGTSGAGSVQVRHGEFAAAIAAKRLMDVGLNAKAAIRAARRDAVEAHRLADALRKLTREQRA